MPITAYTTYADVRAALGVSPDELEDTTLALELYDYNLRLEIEAVSTTLAADYTTVTAIAEETRTSSEANLYRAIRLFATYAVAKQLSSSLPLFGPKDISDGKATVSRFADSPYIETIKEVKRQYERNRSALVDAYGAYKSTGSSSYSRPYFVASGPSTDPVTGA